MTKQSFSSSDWASQKSHALEQRTLRTFMDGFGVTRSQARKALQLAASSEIRRKAEEAKVPQAAPVRQPPLIQRTELVLPAIKRADPEPNPNVVPAAAAEGSSFPEAPTDGKSYGRLNGDWDPVVEESPSDDKYYVRITNSLGTGAWREGILEVPDDEHIYVRTYGEWVDIGNNLITSADGEASSSTVDFGDPATASVDVTLLDGLLHFDFAFEIPSGPAGATPSDEELIALIGPIVDAELLDSARNPTAWTPIDVGSISNPPNQTDVQNIATQVNDLFDRLLRL